ncbi:MAG: hypothetical protein UW18_C0018G0016 [Microgenomates group bacterium GW2011_GWF1_44_10]|nr:MAG: hypothetical protein UW18_C0018G0016 [Microgenomates group bacterium GW2011_GWF1_44_10]
MTETTAINIITVEQVRELPSEELVCFSLSNGETIETAIEKYERTYRMSPQRGWLWGSYLYLEVT